MKKNILVAFAIIFSLSLSSFAYGATEVNQGSEMTFTGTEIKMSLEQSAKLVMTSSSGIETAKINMAASKAKTESYFQSYRKANKEYPDMFGGTSSSSKTVKDMARLSANFALLQSENNYQAEINKLKADTVETYFELQQAINATNISKNNLATQETIMKNTNTKYKLGVVSKQDVLKAEISYNQAKVDLESAQSREALARMNYNIYFDFSIMQKVTLTDTLSVTEVSKIALNDAISLALKNRNEITGAAFYLKQRELNLTEVGNSYSKASSYYLQAQADLMSAKKNSREIPARIEMDVRSKYMNMLNAKSSVDLGKLSADKAAETYRLAKLQFDMGMATLTDAQQAQAGSFASQLQYSQSLLKLKLAVMEYEQATTVGTYSVMF